MAFKAIANAIRWHAWSFPCAGCFCAPAPQPRLSTVHTCGAGMAACSKNYLNGNLYMYFPCARSNNNRSMLYGVLQCHIMMGNTMLFVFFYLLAQSFDHVGLKQNRFSAKPCRCEAFLWALLTSNFFHLARPGIMWRNNRMMNFQNARANKNQ